MRPQCKRAAQICGLLGLVAVTACDPTEGIPPLRIDIAANCAEVQGFPVLRNAILGQFWQDVHAASVAGADQSTLWLLVSDDRSQGQANLRLVYLASGTTELSIPLPDELLATDEPLSFHFEAGPVASEVWLVADSDESFLMWHLDATLGPNALIANSLDLGMFPSTSAFLCEDQTLPCDVKGWHRELVFLEEIPFLVSVAPFSPSGTTYVYLAGIEPSLVLGEREQLEFFEACDPDSPFEEYTLCTELVAMTSFPRIAVMGSQRDQRRNPHDLFVFRERSFADEEEFNFTEVLVLSLKLDGGVPKGELRSRGVDTSPLFGGRGSLAVDLDSTYMLFQNMNAAPGLLQLSQADELSSRKISPVEGFDVGLGSELLQMRGDIAIGQLVDGTWTVTKLFPDAPERSEVYEHPSTGPVRSVAHAGVGAFLLKTDTDAELVALRCREQTP